MVNTDVLVEVWKTPIAHISIEQYEVTFELQTPFIGSVHRFLPKALAGQVQKEEGEDLGVELDGLHWKRYVWSAVLNRQQMYLLLNAYEPSEEDITWTDTHELLDWPDRNGLEECYVCKAMTSRPHHLVVSVRAILDTMPQDLIEVVTVPSFSVACATGKGEEVFSAEQKGHIHRQGATVLIVLCAARVLRFLRRIL